MSDDLRRCGYCDAVFDGILVRKAQDHFIPKWASGTADSKNIVICCSECNYKKGRRIFQNLEDCRLWLRWRYSQEDNWTKLEHDPFKGMPIMTQDELCEAKLIDAISRQISKAEIFQAKPERLNDRNFEWGSN